MRPRPQHGETMGAWVADLNAWAVDADAEITRLRARVAELEGELGDALDEGHEHAVRAGTAERRVAELEFQPPEDSVRLLLPRPKVVTLCGSSRFVAEMAIIAWVFERDEGVITMGLHLLPQGYGAAPDHQAEVEGVAEKMDELHLRKIDLADEVFIVNIGGYIGESTRREIGYAERTGKVVRYLEPLAKLDGGER